MASVRPFSHIEGSEGFITILLALSLVVLIGAIGFVVDLGAMMLQQQRSQTATDLAAIAGTAYRTEYDDQDFARDYAQFTVVANQFAYSRQTNNAWLTALQSVQADSVSTGRAEGIQVSQEQPRRSYFSHLLSGAGAAPANATSVALAATELRTAPTHMVIALEAGLTQAFYMTDSGDFTWTPASRPGVTLTPVHEVTVQTVEALIDELTTSDYVSVIAYSGYAEIISEFVQGSALGKDQIIQAVNEYFDRKISGSYQSMPNTPRDHTAAMHTIGKVLERNADASARAALTTNLFFVNPKTHVYKDEYFALPEDRSDIISYENYLSDHPTMFTEIRSQCPSAGSCELLDDYWPWQSIFNAMLGDPYENDLSSLICSQNPTLLPEYGGTYLLRELAERYEFRLLALSIGNDQRVGGLDTAGEMYVEGARSRNFLAKFANDMGYLSTVYRNSTDCLGPRDPETAGKLFELEGPKESYTPLARKILNDARRGFVSGTDGQSIEPHLVSNL